MGSLYRRGETWWLLYYHNGKRIRESSKSTRKMVAKKLLEQRTGEIARGKTPGIYFDKVTFDELAEDFLADYRINQRKSLSHAKVRVNHLVVFFGGLSATAIDMPRVRRYIEIRLEEGASVATVNRELEALRRMLNLGAMAQKVGRVPPIKNLKENNTRKGFFEREDFLELREVLPAYLKGFVTFAYRSGWRKSEIMAIKWSQVDRKRGIVTLNPGETKNDAARTLYLDGELKEVIECQWQMRMEKERLTPFVFTNNVGSDKIGDFRKAWKTGCQQAGIGAKLFHDLRRTAVRDLVRAGVPERVVMMITGHKTRSIFDRYNIVSDTDLKAAMEKQSAYHDEYSASNSHKKATIATFPHQREESRLSANL